MKNDTDHMQVDERKATRSLLETGLQLISTNTDGISADAIHRWLKDDQINAFPNPSTQLDR